MKIIKLSFEDDKIFIETKDKLPYKRLKKKIL